ncbi:hypothetical protein B0T19DRAFT_418676 [Cercophora scortea]|uniref:Secreted protein n=1 Tax=Cercophora scortea TaxID=314031 RepID=A0AAE0IYI4_9PEZI|nr:hypothetical protein B0T19DRAFT_418676 [Cercophora scortea]
MLALVLAGRLFLFLDAAFKTTMNRHDARGNETSRLYVNFSDLTHCLDGERHARKSVCIFFNGLRQRRRWGIPTFADLTWAALCRQLSSNQWTVGGGCGWKAGRPWQERA